MQQEDALAQRIAAFGAQLSRAERRVAEYLLEAGPEEILLSAAALAERAGSSDATVVRTAKALGYSGLGELRRALAARDTEPPLAERLRRTLAETPRDELLAGSIANHLASLDTLTRHVTPDLFQQAVDVLSASTRVVWRGVGPSAQLAAYGQLLCQRIGRASVALVHTGTSFADELLEIQRGDAVVALAYGRLQPHVRVLFDRAETLDVPVLLITDVPGHRLSDRVAATLPTGRGAPGLFASHATTLVLIEALVLGVAAADEPAAEANLAMLNDLRAALTGRRIDVDSS
jgi:DNA-binding MurR/RpiR family transcriptional regulator